MSGLTQLDIRPPCTRSSPALSLSRSSPPIGVWAVRLAKRQRGGAVLITGLLLIFGMNVQIMPPPPPVAEQVIRAAEDDDNDEP